MLIDKQLLTELYCMKTSVQLKHSMNPLLLSKDYQTATYNRPSGGELNPCPPQADLLSKGANHEEFDRKWI
jgi:hypothetical protein